MKKIILAVVILGLGAAVFLLYDPGPSDAELEAIKKDIKETTDASFDDLNKSFEEEGVNEVPDDPSKEAAHDHSDDADSLGTDSLKEEDTGE